MNKKNIGIIIIAFSIILIISGIIMSSNKKEEKEKEEPNAPVDYNKKSEELCSNIPYIDNNLYYIFDGNVSITVLPEELLVENAYVNMKEKDMNGSIDYFINQSDCSNKGGVFKNGHCYVYDDFHSKVYFFNKEKLLNKIKSMYGIDTLSVDIPTISDNEHYSCDLIEDKYYCSERIFTIEKGDSKSVISYDRYEKTETELYVYVRHLYVVFEDYDEAGNVVVKVYDKKGGNYLGDAYTFDSKVIFDNYKAGSSSYKNTYKLSQNENYTWYSIEPVI